MKILLIEDDVVNAKYIQKGLHELGHLVHIAKDGSDGVWMATEEVYDVIILDRMLPQIDGLRVLEVLREKGVLTPTIMLTAMGSIEDKVAGLRAGSDDYLVKPFAFSELYARICVIVRRSSGTPEKSELIAGPLRLNLLSRKLFYADNQIELQSTEFRLLEYLLRRKGQVVTRTMLLEGVWDFNFDPKTTVVETHISRLRTKLEEAGARSLIKTIRGAGYTIEDDEE